VVGRPDAEDRGDRDRRGGDAHGIAAADEGDGEADGGDALGHHRVIREPKGSGPLGGRGGGPSA